MMHPFVISAGQQSFIGQHGSTAYFMHQCLLLHIRYTFRGQDNAFHIFTCTRALPDIQAWECQLTNGQLVDCQGAGFICCDIGA